MIELLFLAIAPALFILWYVYSKDRYDPEPLRLVVRVFLLGALAVIPAAVIEFPFPPGIITSSVVAPVVEELLKFSVVFYYVYRLPEFDEPVDGIVYAAAAGLGFAALENCIYVLEGGVAVGILRAVASVPGHMIFSCTWGFALGIAKYRPAQKRGWIIAAGIAAAIFLHAVFNFSLEVFESAGLLFILVLLIPFGWWFTRRNIRTAQADPASVFSLLQGPSCERNKVHEAGISEETTAHPGHSCQEKTVSGQGRSKTTRFCTRCGTPITSGAGFCEHCGTKL
jgi:RsiW-degrading membrane proteinase PrsW (M82 family)